MAGLKISLQLPPRSHLLNYNFTLPASAQSPTIPQTFLDALAVRESVFVDEQGVVPLEHHIDTGDGRSYHWVIYPTIPDFKPIGTLRLIPPPHPLHPQPGAQFFAPKPGKVSVPIASEVFAEEEAKECREDRKTTFHDGVESYLQIGRLCVLKEWRGKGVADRLVQEACRWAGENWGEVEELERMAGEGWMGGRKWNGLLLVHARESAVGMWARNGFVVDEGMGGWEEAEIKHVGMFKRVRREALKE